jgi:hypothetical protein
MRLPSAVETALLVPAVIFPFYWINQSYLSKFTLQLTALLILVFIFHNWIIKKQQKTESIKIYQNIINVIIITILTIMLVLFTGEANSDLFVLLDFLLFFVAIFFRAGAAWTIFLALTLAFLLNNPQIDIKTIINLISLLLMTPLAVFFSTQYRQVIIDKKKIETLSNQANLIEQSTLIWLALDFRHQIETAIDLLSQISAPYHQRQRFNQLYQDLKKLWRSGQALEKKIDEATE